MNSMKLADLLLQGLHGVVLQVAIARSLIGILSTEVIVDKTGLSREAIESLSRE